MLLESIDSDRQVQTFAAHARGLGDHSRVWCAVFAHIGQVKRRAGFDPHAGLG